MSINYRLLIIHSVYSLQRESKQDFEEIHGKIHRGDIVGVTGYPGEDSC